MNLRPHQAKQRLAFLFTCAVGLLCCGHLASAQTAPSVTGTVFNDLNQDGSISTGETLTGVSVQLYEDNGDGLFDSVSDVLVNTQLTDANGWYSFGGLGNDSNYFVIQPTQNIGSIALSQSVSDLLTSADFMMLIDDFGSQQEVTANPRIAVGATNLTSSTVIGGQRDLFIQHLAGPAESTLYANPYGLNQVLEFNQSAAVVSVATITWDGIDADLTPSPQPGGLGGIDLTEGGRNIAFQFELGIDAAGAGDILTLNIYSNGGVSTAVVEIPTTNGTATATTVVPFSDFIGEGDLTEVDAIQMVLGGQSPSIDMQLGPIELVRSAVTDFSVASVPEPSAAMLGVTGVVSLAFRRRRRQPSAR